MEGSGCGLSCVTPRHFPSGNEQRCETHQDIWCSVQDANTETAECKSQALKQRSLMYESATSYTESRKVEISVKEASKRFVVIITFRNTGICARDGHLQCVMIPDAV